MNGKKQEPNKMLVSFPRKHSVIAWVTFQYRSSKTFPESVREERKKEKKAEGEGREEGGKVTQKVRNISEVGFTITLNYNCLCKINVTSLASE